MLEKILEQSIESEDSDFGLNETARKQLICILEYATSGKQKAALAVVVTLLLKKIQTPKQDIRYHQQKMLGGFSGRTLDTKTVTPFLRKETFPYMKSGSGWLTRSFEHAVPYNENYTGKVQPETLKEAFLALIDQVQNGTDAKACLSFMFRKLADWRTDNATLALARPNGKGISDIVCIVENHWNSDLRGSAKLPVLAIYAAYLCLTTEVERYKGCSLKRLRSHTSADSKSGTIGDIQVVDSDGKPFEAAEVKHKVPITLPLITGLSDRITSAGLKTYYVLSTNEKISSNNFSKISKQIAEIRSKYGCQVIVNGVATTLRYYLRLVKNTDVFVHKYVEMIGSDDEIPFELKRHWNKVVG